MEHDPAVLRSPPERHDHRAAHVEPGQKVRLWSRDDLGDAEVVAVIHDNPAPMWLVRVRLDDGTVIDWFGPQVVLLNDD